ncbi:MAG: hypothetical protein ACLRSW_13140 [Christensenellaceae bacterium]
MCAPVFQSPQCIRPHHHRLGDPDFVGATAFSDGLGWSDPPEPVWRKEYYFVPWI